MFVLLTQDIPQVGNKNQIVKVSDGYFVNFLRPRGLAKQATLSSLEGARSAMMEAKDKAKKKVSAASDAAVKLAGASLEFSRKTSDKGTLYKALHEKDIVSAIKKHYGVDVDVESVQMEPIKTVGDHVVHLHLGGQDISVSTKVTEGTE